MKFVCVGGGALGLLLSARLAEAGADVAVVTRSREQAELLARDGIALQHGEGTVVVPIRAAAAEDVAAGAAPGRAVVPGGGADWVLVAVKQHHIDAALVSLLERIAGEAGRIACFQNGIGHIERLARRFEANRLYAAVTTEGARKLSAREVAHTGSGTTWLGPATDAAAAGPVEQEAARNAQKMVEQTLNLAGFRILLSNQMSTHVWNKLLTNAVINPLTGLLRLRNGQLPLTDRRLQLMRMLLREGLEVASAAGVRPSERLWELILEVCDKTAGNMSSMLQDLSAGRTTEIDWINGAILEAAKTYGVEAPTHRMMYELVKASEPVE